MNSNVTQPPTNAAISQKSQPMPSVLAKEIGPTNEKKYGSVGGPISSFGLSGGSEGKVGMPDPSTCHETGEGPAGDGVKAYYKGDQGRD